MWSEDAGSGIATRLEASCSAGPWAVTCAACCCVYAHMPQLAALPVMGVAEAWCSCADKFTSVLMCTWCAGTGDCHGPPGTHKQHQCVAVMCFRSPASCCGRRVCIARCPTGKHACWNCTWGLQGRHWWVVCCAALVLCCQFAGFVEPCCAVACSRSSEQGVGSACLMLGRILCTAGSLDMGGAHFLWHLALRTDSGD